MKWLFWKYTRKKKLKHCLRENKITLAGLVETRVKECNTENRLKKITPGWGIVHNYDTTTNGRISFIWDENYYEVHRSYNTSQLLGCRVRDITKDHQVILTFIYGFNTLEQQKNLWSELHTLSYFITGNQPTLAHI